MRNPTIADIRSLGFEWPKYPLIEQYCVMDELQVDLWGTIGKLTKARSEINDVHGQRADQEHQYHFLFGKRSIRTQKNRAWSSRLKSSRKGEKSWS